MTANPMILYSKHKDQFKLSDLNSANLRMILLTSTYTPSVTIIGHGVLADISGELANGNGYTTGGVALTGVVSATAGNDGYKLLTEDAVWTATDGTIPAFRYAALYYLGSLWGVTNPLIGYILCDNTPANIAETTVGNPITISCPSSGWFDLV